MQRKYFIGAAVVVCLILGSPAIMFAQGVGIPIVQSINMIVSTLLSIVRPVAVLGLILCGLTYIFGEGRVSHLGNVVIGLVLALFASYFVALF